MTQKDIYSATTIRANNYIENSIEEFSDFVIQLSMSGQFSDIDNLFSEGDDVVLSVADFIHTSDPKVQSLIKALISLKDAQQAFQL